MSEEVELMLLADIRSLEITLVRKAKQIAGQTARIDAALNGKGEP
jgi:hypothetical protein